MDPIHSQTIYPSFSWDLFGLVVVLIVAGTLLLGTELFIIPGFGVAGVLGLLTIIGGAVMAWVYLGPAWGALIVVASIVVSMVLLIIGLRTGVVKRKMVLSARLARGGGTASGELTELVGAEGVARSDLRPAGIATIGEKRLDVVSEGGFVETGSKVKVVAVDGPRVIVARLD